MTTAEELIDELAWRLYTAVNRPRSTVWGELSEPLREDWREGARTAIRWLQELPPSTSSSDPLPGQVGLDELIG